MNRKVLTTLFVVGAIAAPVTAALVEVDFTPDALGISKGNVGTSLVVDDLFITALENLDPPGTGSLYLNNKGGLGVQSLSGPGRSSIAGGYGYRGDKAVVFDFTNNVDAASIVVTLTSFKDKNDSPKLILAFSDGSEQTFTKSHSNWFAATSVSHKRLTINMGTLLGSIGGIVDKLTVAETTGSTFVGSLEYETINSTIPEPITLCLLGAGSLALFIPRKNSKYQGS